MGLKLYCSEKFLEILILCLIFQFSIVIAKVNDDYVDNFKDYQYRKKIAASFVQYDDDVSEEYIPNENQDTLVGDNSGETAIEHFKEDFEKPIEQSPEIFWENSHFHHNDVDYPDVTIESFYTNPNDLNKDPLNGELAVKDKEAIKPETEDPDLLERNTNIGPPYRLHIGDVLLISIYGEAATRREVIVDPSGSISFLIVNSLPVVGKTINEVRINLQDRLKKMYKHALVVISAIHFAGDYYSITGEVRRPGKFAVRGDSTLLSAIAESSGFNLGPFRDTTINLEDLDRSFIARDGEYLPVDFSRLVEQGDLSQDIPLKGGDYIYIASANANQVFVLGEVFGATTLNYWREKITLAQAIAQAGGTTLVASSRIAVIRGSLACPTHYLIDFNRIQKGYACDFVLESGDIVYVPPRNFTFLREIIKAGIATFISTAASVAGYQLFITTTPAAGFIGSGTIAPVPVLPLGTSTSSFIAPASASPVILPAH